MANLGDDVPQQLLAEISPGLAWRLYERCLNSEGKSISSPRVPSCGQRDGKGA